MRIPFVTLGFGYSLFLSPIQTPPRLRRRRRSYYRTFETLEDRSLLSANVLMLDTPVSMTTSMLANTPFDIIEQNRPEEPLGHSTNLGVPSVVFEAIDRVLPVPAEIGKPEPAINSLVSDHPISTTVLSLSSTTTSSSPVAVSVTTTPVAHGLALTISVRPYHSSLFFTLSNSLSRSTSRLTSLLSSNWRPSSAKSQSLGFEQTTSFSDRTGQSHLKLATDDQFQSNAVSVNSIQSSTNSVAVSASMTQPLANLQTGSTGQPALASLLASERNSLKTGVVDSENVTQKFPLFDTDPFKLFHGDPFAVDTASGALMGAFVPIMPTIPQSERIGLPPTKQPGSASYTDGRESDLILSGKQAPRELEEALYWSRGVDAFFMRDGNGKLFSKPKPGGKATPSDGVTPNLPGVDGNAAPAASPQNPNNDSGASIDRAENPNVEEAGMTWVGLAAILSGGFRTLRNRRRKKTDGE